MAEVKGQKRLESELVRGRAICATTTRATQQVGILHSLVPTTLYVGAGGGFNPYPAGRDLVAQSSERPCVRASKLPSRMHVRKVDKACGGPRYLHVECLSLE